MPKKQGDPIKKGARVEILEDIAPLRHRKNRTGMITCIDGGYIYVRPSWCKWVVQLYSHEIRVL